MTQFDTINKQTVIKYLKDHRTFIFDTQIPNELRQSGNPYAKKRLNRLYRIYGKTRNEKTITELYKNIFEESTYYKDDLSCAICRKPFKINETFIVLKHRDMYDYTWHIHAHCPEINDILRENYKPTELEKEVELLSKEIQQKNGRTKND